MKKLDEQGSLNKLLFPLVGVSVLTLGSLIFGIWAFMGRSDLKNNIDKKVDERLVVESQRIETEQQNIFTQKEKEPLKPYKSPSEVGSVEFNYPKTWSGYVDESPTGSLALNGTFYPDFVPADDASYALRVEVINADYSNEVKKFESRVNSGLVKISAYKPENVEGAIAVKITGQLTSKVQGTMIVVQVRDKTLRLWTESDLFLGDFEKRVLPSLTFSP